MTTEETLEISREDAEHMIYGGTCKGYEVVEPRQFQDHGRWTVIRMLVFKKEGDEQLWGVEYEVPATEYQSKEPFYSDPVICKPVVEEIRLNYDWAEAKS